MLRRIVTNLEGFAKGLLFDCRRCGQCVLRSTRLLCPMRCPKGLRNGPCGGTLDGRCEVHPDRRCQWVRIDGRRRGEEPASPPILPALDHHLVGGASLVHAATGADRAARVPLAPLVGSHRPEAAQTASRLERVLRAGRFVYTTEIRAPRRPSLAAVRRHAALLGPHFDAVNATAYLAGEPSLPSSRVAAELAGLGIDAVAQATCRDHTRTTFVGELLELHWAGVHNLLCLTGDAHRGRPGIRQVWEMDSSLMCYEARHLRDHGRIHCTGAAVAEAPRPFLGAAINPNTRPLATVVRRALQKADAGAEFVQTQIAADRAAFEAFARDWVAVGLHHRLYLLAGVPVVVSRRALELLTRIPGVRLPDAVRRRLEEASDIRAEGIALARELVASYAALHGVDGVHLMLFGADHEALIEVRRDRADRPRHLEKPPCPYPDSPSSANASIPASPVPSA